MHKVLVTGANGHIGYHLVQRLVQRGYAVRAGMRHAADTGRAEPLRALGAEVVQADLLDEASLRRAMEGAVGLFQNAAVYRLSGGHDAEILAASLQGAENALRAAKAGGVQRVVFTSSCVAVGFSRPGGPPRTEADWAADAALPYLNAKRDAERRAHEFAKAEGLNLVSVLPGNVMGPGFRRHTPSTVIVELLLRNAVPAAPAFQLFPVDVRDVAAAMVNAYEREGTRGRYLLTGESVRADALAALMHRIDPAVRMPWWLPRWLWPLVPALDALNARSTGQPHVMTRAFMADVATRETAYVSARAHAELGWSPRPLAETVKDTMDWIRGRDLSMAGV